MVLSVVVTVVAMNVYIGLLGELYSKARAVPVADDPVPRGWGTKLRERTRVGGRGWAPPVFCRVLGSPRHVNAIRV